MRKAHIGQYLWGEKARPVWLYIAALLLLFAYLGSKEIWTQEHRWADIVFGMFYRHDFLHPYLGSTYYYDKPLLSYWLMALCAHIIGELNTIALRLPSAIAGFFALYALYLLGCRLKNKHFGLLAAWVMLSTYYFLFWARVSSADMLNLAGTLLAITWYFYHEHEKKFVSYFIFFTILALTSLCKGLVGAIVPLLAVFIDMLLKGRILFHCNRYLLLSIVPAVLIYLLPFILSSVWGGENYQENGLYLVYRENVLRYFKPFDHHGPFYTYFIYLPIYLLPWTIFLFPAIARIVPRYRTMDLSSKWISLTLLTLFLFFTLSGSRRSYYVLPMVPFAILFITDWLLEQQSETFKRWIARFLVAALILVFAFIDVLPAWYYTHYGVSYFASKLKQEAEKVKPWQDWRIELLDPESKVLFYLHLPPQAKAFDVDGDRNKQTLPQLLKAFPTLSNTSKNTLFISRKVYEPLLKPLLPGYKLIELKQNIFTRWANKDEDNNSIAFIPEHPMQA